MRRSSLVLFFVATVVTAGAVACQPESAVPPPTQLATVGVDQPSHLYCRFLATTVVPVSPVDPTPAELRAFWDARRAFEHRALIAAPAAIAADWALVASFTRDELTPAIEAIGHARVPAIPEPDVVRSARVRIAVVDAGCTAVAPPA